MERFKHTDQELAFRRRLAELLNADMDVLIIKGRSYGDSWKKRGGIGAFMMLARKWDRIENIVKNEGYDVFKAMDANVEDVLDDIADLRRYLTLVENEYRTYAADPFAAGFFEELRRDADEREQENMRTFDEYSRKQNHVTAEDFSHEVVKTMGQPDKVIPTTEPKKEIPGMECAECGLLVAHATDPFLHIASISLHDKCYRCARADLNDEERANVQKTAGQMRMEHEVEFMVVDEQADHRNSIRSQHD